MRRRTFVVATLIALALPYSSPYGKSAISRNIGKINKADMARLREALLRARGQAGLLRRTISKYKDITAGRSEVACFKLLRNLHARDVVKGNFLVLEGVLITPAEWLLLFIWSEQ